MEDTVDWHFPLPKFWNYLVGVSSSKTILQEELALNFIFLVFFLVWHCVSWEGTKEKFAWIWLSDHAQNWVLFLGQASHYECLCRPLWWTICKRVLLSPFLKVESPMEYLKLNLQHPGLLHPCGVCNLLLLHLCVQYQCWNLKWLLNNWGYCGRSWALLLKKEWTNFFGRLKLDYYLITGPRTKRK